MWRSFVPKGWTRAAVYLSPEAEAWKKEIALRAKLAGFREPMAGSIALRVVHHHRAVVQSGSKKGQRNGHVFDLDNVLKVTIDALKGVVFADDRQVKKIVAEYGAETSEGGIVIHVENFVLPETLELFPGLPFSKHEGLRDSVDDIPF